MSWTNTTKAVASFVQTVKHILTDGFLLKEDGFYLLLETGGKIELEDSTGYQFQAKNTS